jgi:DNA mismatch repair protein MutS
MSTGLLNHYWETQKTYEKKYNNCVVLVEKGGFFECYEHNEVGRACDVSKVLNMHLTQSNKNLPLSDTNPFMTGFPSVSINKNLLVLNNYGFTVVLIEQQTSHGKIFRKVTRVITPGTYIEQPPDENDYNICCIHVIHDESYSVCVTDLSIGKVEFFDIQSKDDYIWFFEIYKPKECIFLTNDKKQCEYVQCIYNRFIHEYPQYFNKSFQQNVVEKVYNDMFEITNENMIYIPSLVCLLDFIFVCHESALVGLQTPIFPKQNYLTLHNNASTQLDLFSNHRGKGLVHCIDNTITPMGKRLLRKQICKPMIDSIKIEDTLNKVDNQIHDNHWKHIENVLKGIPDIERLLKKITLHSVTIDHIKSLYYALQKIKKLDDHTKTFVENLEYIFHDIFDFEKDIFHSSFSKEYNDIQTKVSLTKEKINTIIQSWSEFVTQTQKKQVLSPIKLESTEKDGYYLLTSIKRADEIKKNVSDLTVKKLTSSAKIFNNESNQLCETYTKYMQQYHKIFTDCVKLFGISLSKYTDQIFSLSNYIAEQDTLKSKAKFAIKNNHVKPIVCHDNNHSFIHSNDLKHPIIEYVNDNVECIGNDIKLNHEQNGMLLYGVNGSGKSSFGKAIAINILLAQSGHFVAASFLKLSPFHHVFTRISGEDNLYKSQSSFDVEMKELRSILKFSNDRSLVIGDEVCKGTEHVSAVSMVASSIDHMLNKGTNFIFATHLHQLTELSCFKNRSNLQIKHIESYFDTTLKCLIFKRKLKDGQGEQLYGIEVSKQIIDIPEITNMAMVVRNELLKQNNFIVHSKKSKYNSKVHMTQCEHCKSNENLHTHHIQPQNEFTELQKTQMNKKHNLVVLCDKCHHDYHHGKLQIQKHDIGKKQIFTFS